MRVPVTRALSLRFEETLDTNRIRLALGGALLCLLVLGARGAHADEGKPAEPAKPTAEPLTDVLAASGIDLHGYVDVAYSYLSGAGVFTSGVADRVFDTEPNSFNVHQAALIVDYQPKEGFGGLVALTAGRDARVIASLGESTSNCDVTQAFAQYAHGPLTIIAGTHGLRSLIDAVGTYNATSQLTFILNVDWGQQENVTSLVTGTSITAKWDGAAAYANYQVNDQWRLSVRAEYFDDKDGYRTGVIQKWKEATLTLAYLPTKFIELRAEVRGDKSDSSVFVKDATFLTGAPGAGMTDNQFSAGLEAVYRF